MIKTLAAAALIVVAGAVTANAATVPAIAKAPAHKVEMQKVTYKKHKKVQAMKHHHVAKPAAKKV